MKTRILLGSALGTALVGVALAISGGGAFAHPTAATPSPVCDLLADPEPQW